MAEGTDQWALAAPLDRVAGEPLVRKRCRDSFVGTDLAALLTSLSVQQLVVIGALSDYRIRTTTRAAVGRGFDVTLVSDAHTTTDAGYDGVVITGEEIVAHTNLYFDGLPCPGRRSAEERHDQVQLHPGR